MYITPEDLAPFATISEGKAAAMIADAEAKATLAAPALADPSSLSEAQRGQVKAILRDAILRWNDRGSGALTQTSIGQVSVSADTRITSRNLFTAAELDLLRSIAGGSRGGAFSLDLAAGAGMRGELTGRPDLKFQWG